MSIMRTLRIAIPPPAFALASLWASSTSAMAYGSADQPLAQLELSGNCNDPDFALCAPPPRGFGLGGIWLWIEIDADKTGDIAGAGCGHVQGVRGGASPIVGDITWQYGTVLDAFAQHAFVAGQDPSNTYYIITVGFEKLAFPTTVGHYSWQPVPAVTIEAQTAP